MQLFLYSIATELRLNGNGNKNLSWMQKFEWLHLLNEKKNTQNYMMFIWRLQPMCGW